jgi:hypothetical protein
MRLATAWQRQEEYTNNSRQHPIKLKVEVMIGASVILGNAVKRSAEI